MRQLSPTLVLFSPTQAAGPPIRYHAHTNWVRPSPPSCCCPQPGRRLFPVRLYPHPHYAIKISSTRTRAARDAKNSTNTRVGFRAAAGTPRPASTTRPSQPHALQPLSRNDQSGGPRHSLAWIFLHMLYINAYIDLCQSWLFPVNPLKQTLPLNQPHSPLLFHPSFNPNNRRACTGPAPASSPFNN